MSAVLAAYRRRRHRTGGDEGFTLLVVVVSMVPVMAIALVGVSLAIDATKNSRASQDTKSALGAAQSGVTDYLARLNQCDTYWVPGNRCALSTAGLDGWVTLSGVGANVVQYHQEVVNTPLNSTSLRLLVTGKTRSETRTVTVDIAKTGFLAFLYYTTYETRSPADQALAPGNADRPLSVSRDTTSTFQGSGTTTTYGFKQGTRYTLLAPTADQVVKGCSRPAYDGSGNLGNRTTFPRSVRDESTKKVTEVWPRPTDGDAVINSNLFSCSVISFGGFDVLSGPVHSEDALRISGAATFKAPVTTTWKDPDGRFYWGEGVPATGPGTYQPKNSTSVPIPDTNADVAGAAARGGCVYSGPTEITFLPSGRMTVLSPNTKQSDVATGCAAGNSATFMTTAQEVAGPPNGVIYTKNYSGGTATCISSYQKVSGDVTRYDNANCSAGDLFVSGTVKGQWTGAAAHDVVVVADLTVLNSMNGTSVVGLVAQNNVSVWHPVSSNGTELASVHNRKIEAAVAAVAGSFSVLNFDRGSALGTLTVNGVIVQKYRGTVATSGYDGNVATGYAKNYNYDKRLPQLPPPAFLAPVNDPWSVTKFSEQ